MDITILSGPPGCQKTHTMLREMLDTRNRYLLAAPRIDLIEEHADWLRTEAQNRGASFRVEVVHGRQGRSDVGRRIADACRTLSAEEHVALLITHEALLRLDLAPFVDADSRWHARIDEFPDALASGIFRAPAAAQYLEQVYELAPSTAEGWWQVRLKPDAPAPNALMRDTHLSGLVAFDKRARSAIGGVLVNVGDWRDATLKGRTVKWYSAWTPALLKDFDSVALAGANFWSSLCGLASQRLDENRVSYQERRLAADRSRGKPSVLIRYFAREHVGSTAWWADGDGKRCLNRVIRHLMAETDLGFYSGNSLVMEYAAGWLDHAEAVAPKQAGTNSLIHHTSCAFIYSNKAQDADAPIREALGFTTADIQRARETEDLIQFVMRGAIRDPAFSGVYRVYLYDEAQALVLRDYLLATGVTDDVRAEAVEEAGILDQIRPEASGKRVAQAADQTFEERERERRAADAERKRRKRAADKEARLAEGTYRGRGRPTNMIAGSSAPC